MDISTIGRDGQSCMPGWFVVVGERLTSDSMNTDQVGMGLEDRMKPATVSSSVSTHAHNHCVIMKQLCLEGRAMVDNDETTSSDHTSVHSFSSMLLWMGMSER